MPHPARRTATRNLCAGVVAIAVSVGAVGCGSKADISQAIDSANKQLEAADAKLSCPDEVDNESKPFDCTVTGTKTGKTAPVKMKIESDSITPADQDAYQKALEQVSGP